MADIVKDSHRVSFGFDFIRGDSTASRTISLDQDNVATPAAISAAKAFREEMLGGGSMFSVIDPTKFIQPTNWRDTDETEEEWTTKDITIEFTDTYTTIVDTSGDGIQLEVTYDATTNSISIHYTGNETPRVFFENDSSPTPALPGEEHYWSVQDARKGTYYIFAGKEAKVITIQ